MRLLRSTSSAFALLVTLASALHAQSGVTVTGTVTSNQGVPLPGATVFLQGTNIGAQTDEAGRFTFVVPSTRANGQAAVLTARVIGYTASSTPITLTAGSAFNHDFLLTVNPFHLGEVVVTGAGTAGQSKKTRSLFVVPSVASQRLLEAPQRLETALFMTTS